MIIPSIVSQHCEEAAFLWLLRRGAIGQPHYQLSDLAKLDSRVEAHLDGLRIAGNEGWVLIQEALSAKESGEFFVAAELAFETGDRARIDSVLQLLEENLEGVSGVISALGWLSPGQAKPHLERLLNSSDPTLRRVGLAGAAIHRFDPGLPLRDALSDNDPLLRARAARAVGELGCVEALPTLRGGFTDPDPSVHFAAAWSATLRSANRDALRALQDTAESAGPHAYEALQTAVRRMDPSAAKSWQGSLSRRPQKMRLAVIAAGAIGDPVLVPWLIEQMKIAPAARAAGEAFTMITGIDLAYQDLEQNAPEGFEAGPTENPEDENIEMDPDEHLPWPDPALVHNWWTKTKGQFSQGSRYLCGKPISAEWLQRVLRIGRQRQRTAAALELALRHPSEPLFEVRAPGFRQQSILGPATP